VIDYTRTVSETEGSESSRRYRELMGASSTLMSRGRNEEALQLLDDAIAMAIGEREIRWALAYCRQATYIAKALKDFSKVKHYCETCLAQDPDDSWALSRLADVARRQGEIELAEEYTARYHKAALKRRPPARIIPCSTLPPGFPAELASAVFSSGNEVAWPLNLSVLAVEWFGSHGYAILGTELWEVRADGKSLRLGPGGVRGVCGNTVNRQRGEAWNSFVERSAVETRAYLRAFSASDIAEPGRQYFQVVWMSESGFPI